MTKRKIARTPKRTKNPAKRRAPQTLGEYLAERGTGTPSPEGSRLAADGKRYAVDPANPLRFKEQPLPAGLVERAAARAGIRSTAPGPWRISGPPFDGGEDLRRDATPADLFGVAFDADPNEKSFLTGAVQCAIDDFELIELAISDDANLADLLRRAARRANYRLRVAVEVNRRMAEAVRDDEQAEQGSEVSA